MIVVGENSIRSVELCVRSWYGHPEANAIDTSYLVNKQRVRDRNGGRDNPEEAALWRSGLRCWNLIDADGLKSARAYEPTDKTPRWVFVEERGECEIPPPLPMEELLAMMVTYRLQGGTYE